MGCGNVSVIVEGEGAYIVAYDLPSENVKDLSDVEAKEKVRNVRVGAVLKLHSLGIMCTESVILVPSGKAEKIDSVINEVYSDYEELNKWLETKGFVTLNTPLIRKIKLTAEQKEDFKELAERRVKEKLDEVIESLTNLLNEIENIIEEEKLRRIERNLRRQERELERLEVFCKELGIEANHKFELLSQLYDGAYAKLKMVHQP